MASHENTGSTSSSRTASERAARIRQPVSCEPCRKRKIRCSRTRPPCDTCRRRRCMESCYYPGAGGQDTGAFQSAPPDINATLEARISNLENMLRQHNQVPVENDGVLGNSRWSPPIEAHQPYGLSPDSLADMSQISYSPAPTPLPLQHIGSLVTSSSGNVRYEPQASQ
jgi:hypothetical protein